jgi:hypothetical protein
MVVRIVDPAVVSLPDSNAGLGRRDGMGDLLALHRPTRHMFNLTFAPPQLLISFALGNQKLSRQRLDHQPQPHRLVTKRATMNQEESVRSRLRNRDKVGVPGKS